MKKLIRLAPMLLTMICSVLLGQNIRNTEWIKIKAERIDGSRIIDRSFSFRSKMAYYPIRYFFLDSTTYLSSYDGEYVGKYKQNGKILTTGIILGRNFSPESEYRIDSLSNIVLILTELPNKKIADDNINRYYFIKSKYYMEYLKSNGKIKMSHDTIECNKFLFPYHRDDIDGFLASKLNIAKKRAFINGSILFTPEGKLTRVNIDSSENLSENQLNKFREVLLSSKEYWSLPVKGKNHYFRMTFRCTFSIKGGSQSFTNLYYPMDSTQLSLPLLPSKKIEQINDYYKKGVSLLNENKYEKAIGEFSKCLEIDSLNVNSYYNKAYAHFKIHQTNMACGSWRKLSELGQKQGESLFKENCK